ncbi:MAG: hypothetical protein R2873_00420 [Caldilineaceae bacterium]
MPVCQYRNFDITIAGDRPPYAIVAATTVHLPREPSSTTRTMISGSITAT